MDEDLKRIERKVDRILTKMGEDFRLNDHQKKEIRRQLFVTADGLLGVPYEFGAEWKDYSVKPLAIDCSEMLEGVYKINGLKQKDGSQNQYNFTIPTPNPQIGDLAFFGRGGKPHKIYHVGMVYDADQIIEARGFQPGSSFETGKVILRPRANWERYKNFVGYRVHPKLA